MNSDWSKAGIPLARPGLVPWPEEYVDRYVRTGYWRGVALGAGPWEWARRYGPDTALVDGPTRITYQELAEQTDALAARLLACGLMPGDNIAVQLPNCWEFVVLFLACQRIGVAPALVVPQYRDRELLYFVDRIEATAIVVQETWRDHDQRALAGRVAERAARTPRVLVVGQTQDADLDLRPKPREDSDVIAVRRTLDRFAPEPGDAALFLLSGGTTGTPKIIARTHDDYDCSIRFSAEACDYGPNVVFLAALPVAHGLTLGGPGVLGTLYSGGRVVFAPTPHPQSGFPLIQSEHVTTTAVTPAVAQRWLDAKPFSEFDLGSLEVVQVAGAQLPPEVAVRIETMLGCRVQQVYGMSEGLHCYVRSDDPPEVALHTQGRPICPDDELLIVDGAVPCTGTAVEPGAVGELLVRGPTTIRGYFAAPETDEHSFTPGGWYRTGDLVRQNPSGHLNVIGRLTDMINRGGEKFAAEEVESALLGLSQVRQLSVVPYPDAELGERVCVCVVLPSGQDLDLDQVREVCAKAGLAEFKTPERLVQVDALPLTPIGKVDKPALRSRIADKAT